MRLQCNKWTTLYAVKTSHFIFMTLFTDQHTQGNVYAITSLVLHTTYRASHTTYAYMNSLPVPSESAQIFLRSMMKGDQHLPRLSLLNLTPHCCSKSLPESECSAEQPALQGLCVCEPSYQAHGPLSEVKSLLHQDSQGCYDTLQLMNRTHTLSPW